ncbi:MAG: UDP-N-acetylglucosamine diphosphorylase/glucosamine-1-phosphate N-acetyltransferase [Candidatus Marinimicrobia bacterium]|nr:UDP-N-acetylglucosamine diphosphorylase/glucosamine-1-phosphate N-acetyltransferase [Candidatus Neomarinimicrobiota bacterium]|tara:strand:+ start:5190 stop:6464 length:1275 start_codon:yes stop_codon:yes gene_type:complete
MNNITTVILAAGKSTRFISSDSKLTHDLAGLPIVSHVYNTAKKISGKNIIVVCNKDNRDELSSFLKNCKFVIQKNPKGTADAIETAKPFIKTKTFIILFGDVPLITDSSLKKLIKSFKNKVGSMILFKSFDPYGYGRVILEKNKVVKVVEEIHTSKSEKLIDLCNSGIMLVNKSIFFKLIKLIKFSKIKKERYLTDIFEIYFKKNIPFTFTHASEDEMSGINNLFDYNKVDRLLQKRLVTKFLNNGVLIKNPETCYFSYDTKIEKKVIIEPNVTIRNAVSIKSGSVIKNFSDLEGVLIRENCSIGPHARLRSKSIIQKNCKIGNYVEIKNSNVGSLTSISHLSYVGDSKIGNKVNIGAGCITCNYDGVKKNKTVIGNNSFIGSNTSLIAPLKIGNNVKIAAGSVINKDIPSNKLAIRRPKLKIY